MADFEIESDDYDFMAQWDGKNKKKKGGYFGAGNDDDMNNNAYDFEIGNVTSNKSKKGTSKTSKKSPTYDFVDSPVGGSGVRRERNGSNKTTNNTTKTNNKKEPVVAMSAIEKAQSMLAKYSTTTTTSNKTSKPPFARTGPKDYDEDDISIGKCRVV